MPSCDPTQSLDSGPADPRAGVIAPSARILILTAGFGEGHNAAARALAAACDSAAGPGTARVVDLFALASPRFNALARRAYLGMINATPRLWNAVYRWIDRGQVLPRRLWALRTPLRILETLLAAERPTAICSTYPVYPFLLEKLRQDGRLAAPHYTVVTDSISINSLWWRAGCAGWFLPNEDTAEVMRAAGIDPARLHVHGFPVTSFFSDHAALLAPPDLRTSPPRVLYIAHSGMLHAAETARRLLNEENWEVTCAVGRDKRLRDHLSLLAAGRGRPAQVLGWTDKIPSLLMTHHVVVSKAGGATVQEALAARCPMIVNQVVPGQEEGNFVLLQRHGGGVLADTPEAVIGELRRVFAARGGAWRTWRRALEPLARPEAAAAIARHILFDSVGAGVRTTAGHGR
jgi:processive 1,2-diacylglycerol beta-glucosyltransferase